MTTRIYNVAYWIEAGFNINVEARTRAEAIRIVRMALDDEMDVLPGSERVHYDDGLTGGIRLVKGTDFLTPVLKKGGAA